MDCCFVKFYFIENLKQKRKLHYRYTFKIDNVNKLLKFRPIQRRFFVLRGEYDDTKMNWDEDLDFTAGKKIAPKQGRRAGLSPDSSDQSPETLLQSLNLNQSPPDALLRTRKTGKWGDDGGKSKSKNTPSLMELERFQTEKVESDDDIPIIPDIEEFQDDPTTPDDIKPPIASGLKSTYKELDTELKKLHSSQKFDADSQIDLSALTSRLYPEKDVKEIDEEWTMDYLLDTILKHTNK